MREKLIILMVLSVFLFACTPAIDESLHPIQQPGKNTLGDELIYLEELPIQTLPNGEKYIIHPDKLSSGGPPQDGIPSIDEPQFQVIEEANSWLEDDNQLLFLNYNGVRKAYPLSIMTWHEIVNDYAAGIPVAITYCPLCATGIAYERIIQNKESEFGTSGKLFNSNLVMYDRNTKSLWTQVDGIAIQGELSGTLLKQIPLDVISWKDIKDIYPDTIILSEDTGFERNYGHDPYITYYTDDTVWFPIEFRNFSVDTKEVVYGIEVNGEYKAYKESDIMSTPIEDEVGGEIILIRKGNGVVNTSYKESGEEIIEERHFWFSWYAFHPETKLYEK